MTCDGARCSSSRHGAAVIAAATVVVTGSYALDTPHGLYGASWRMSRMAHAVVCQKFWLLLK